MLLRAGLMKPTLALLFAAAAAVSAAAAPSLKQVWQTEATLKVPEGVLFDATREVLYVSNIDGRQPWEKDGTGSIARVGLDGQVREVEWVKGLHAPKGLALAKGRLYVADIDRIVIIDPERGEITATVPVPEAQRLNDVSAAADGTVYVTDSAAGRVYVLRHDKPALLSDAFKSPNGVLATAEGLYVLDQETLFKLPPQGEPVAVVKGLVGHVDGVEVAGPGAFIVSCWNGIIYHATTAGTVTTLLDTRQAEINAADIGYDAKRRIVYVPTFWKNRVVAYQLGGD